MKKIFGDAKDKYVSNVVLYGHSDNILYQDGGHTQAINRADLLDLCMKGLVLVSKDGSYYKPVSFKDNTTDVSVSILTAASTLGTLKSKEAE